MLGIILCTSLIGQAVAQTNTTAAHTLVQVDTPVPVFADVHYIAVDQAIKNATPYWLFLVVDEEGKSTWLNDINNSTVSDSEKSK